MTYQIAVDIGGTFTDCAVIDSAGRRQISKALTTPDQLERGVLDAVREAARLLRLELGVLLSETDLFVHGTTQATNAMVTRTGARTGLITSRGHEDALAIGKVYSKIAGLGEREMVHSSRLAKPEPIVPRELVRGVNERIDRDGEIITALADADVLEAIESLRGADVEAIAVSLLWSCVNSVHERRIKELVAEQAPDVFVAYSHEVAPVVGEYERTATTAVSAYVGPKVSRYLRSLAVRLQEEGLAQQMVVMQASGGITSVENACDQPILTLDSGPAGGILGSRYLGERLGEKNVICTDVGGTTFDVGVILDGRVPLDPEPVVSQFTLRIPKVMVQSIGSGGGSIAWLDEGGLLRVGPQSAGSYPGPACYDRGGHYATVTDADLVLGYLSTDSFLGGRMPLSRDKALQVLASLGARLAMEPEEVAVGVARIINAQMADLIYRSTVMQGHDPRDCVIFAYGGAAPTHAPFYGANLGSPATIVPADSTVFSAAGMLSCDLVHTAQQSRRTTSPYTPGALQDASRRFEELERGLLSLFASEGADTGRVQFARSLGIRFREQVHTVEVPVSGALTEESFAEALELFRRRYAQLYGEAALSTDSGTEFELHRVVATIPLDRPSKPPSSAVGRDASGCRKGERPAHFHPLGFIDTAIYDGARLAPGMLIQGPAIIERMGDSVVVPPDQEASLDEELTLKIVQSDAIANPNRALAEVHE